MGAARRHRGDPPRRHPAARRVRRRAARDRCRPSRPQYRVDPGPPMVRMWVDRARFRPYPADGPAPAAGRDRRAQPAVPAGLRVVAAVVSAIAEGVYYGIRVNGQLVAAAGHARDQRAGPARRRRQRPDPCRLSRPRLRDRRDRRGDRGAAADLRPGRAQRPLRQPARARTPTAGSATPSTSASRSASSTASGRRGPTSRRRCAASSPARRPTADDDRRPRPRCPPTT